jgi:hypothetical protein
MQGGCSVKVAYILWVCNSSFKFLFKLIRIFFFHLFDLYSGIHLKQYVYINYPNWTLTEPPQSNYNWPSKDKNWYHVEYSAFLPRESLLQARRHKHLTNMSHVSCTHLTRTGHGECKWKVRHKYVSRNCFYATFLLSPLILDLRHAQGDRKGNVLSSYKSFAGWLQI